MESMFSSPDLQLPSCDVRDVARAHILAAETPTASGRCTPSAGVEVKIMLRRSHCQRQAHAVWHRSRDPSPFRCQVVGTSGVPSPKRQSTVHSML